MKRFGAVLLAGLLAACSSNDNFEEPAKLEKILNKRDVKRVWSEDVGVGTGEQLSIQAMSILDDTIFTADAKGRVTALNRENGDELWEVKLKQPVSGGAGVAGDLVLVGSLNGEVFALDTASGELRWQATVGGEVLAPPQGNGNVVVVQTLSGRLYGLNASDGSELWFYDNTTPALTLRGTATPTVLGNTVFAGFASGKILALDINEGLLQWEQRVAVAKGRSELERVIDIEGSPLLIGDTLFSASYQGRLVAVDRNSGRGLWAKDESTYSNLSSGMGYVYVANADGVVKAYRASNGEVVWENDQLQRRQLGAPQTFGSFVAVADFAGYVHIMNQSNGEIVARRKVDGDGIRSPMLSRGDILYVHGNSGDLEALSVK